MLKTNVFTALSVPANFLFDEHAPLAQKSEFIIRITQGFSASSFVLSLIKSVITSNASFNQNASNLSLDEK